MKQLVLFALLPGLLLCSFIPPVKQIVTLKDMKKALKLGYSYVPGGNTVVDGDTVALKGFFMMKTEVSNSNYLEYLHHLKKAGDLDAYNAALPDTNAWTTYKNPWTNRQFCMTKFAEYYFNHPAYRDFPVVNVTQAQAEKYCEFLTIVWREKTGNNTIVFRLPHRAEFVKAANGKSFDRPYSWNDAFLHTRDGRTRCNFSNIDERIISRDSVTGGIKLESMPANIHTGINAWFDLTAPVKSYWENEFDLYNLNGNVAEMICDQNIVVGGDWYSPGYEVRNQAAKPYTGANPMTGFRPVMTFVEKQP